MRRARRHVRQPPDLTSLFDVLFIVIFAALIRAAAVQQAAAVPAPPPPKPAAPPVPLDPKSLHARALATIDREVAERTSVVVRISAKGSITALESGGKTIALDAPLLEHSPDPDAVVAYLGDRSAELRICRVAAVHLGAADLTHHLLILAPDALLDDLPHALYEGLHRDIDRCLAEQRGLAVLVEPTPAGHP